MDRSRVELIPWVPLEPYLSVIRSCSTPQEMEDVYYVLSEEWGHMPLFYFDIGMSLYHKNQVAFSIQVLTNLVEIDLANDQYMRILAFWFEIMGLLDYSVNLYERVMKTRTEEPQSYRDLANVLMKRKNLKTDDVQRALTYLTDVVQGDWDIRFTQVEAIALMELCRYHKDLHLPDIVANDKLWNMLQNFDIPLNIPMHSDLRVVLSWDTDMVDLELHVVEPDGQHCHSFHNHTTNGGLLSKDMGGGLGPESYLIRNAPPGSYKITVKLFASKGRTVLHGVTAMVRIFTNYGRPELEKEFLTLARLKDDKEVVHVATVHFE